MTTVRTLRLQQWLSGLWAGSVVSVGAIAAPALFSVLDRSVAGQGAGQIFAIEGKVSLAFAVVLFLLERSKVRADGPGRSSASVMSGNLLLILAALFLTVFGQFALHPMIAAAKAGQPTALSFGALHGLSAGLYWLKALVLLALAWRCAAP